MEFKVMFQKCSSTDLNKEFDVFACNDCGDCFWRDGVENFKMNNKFPILDISKISLVTEVEKLTEETHEFINAIANNDEDNMIEEFFDVIQVMANILHRYELTDKLEEGLKIHNEKILSRGWKIEKYL